MKYIIKMKPHSNSSSIVYWNKDGKGFVHKEGDFVVNSRDEAIESYREWVVKQPQLLKDLHELKGKTLGCFCKPKGCHGDILVELVNGLGE